MSTVPDVTDETTEADKRAAYTAGLRELADFLDATRGVDLPYEVVSIYGYGARAKAKVADVARLLAPCEKGGDDLFFTLTRRFGPVLLTYKVNRSAVCEKRMVTREVEEWVCPPLLGEATA